MVIKETAYTQSKAIDRCASLGRQFIDHFHKVVEEGDQSPDFKHHCQEMQTWWEDVRDIVLKHNKKRISKVDLIDWFFTKGSSIEIQIKESYQELYEELCVSLISDYSSTVEEILSRLLKESSNE